MNTEGRWEKVWLSPELLDYAAAHEVDPAQVASAAAHTLALRNCPGLTLVALPALPAGRLGASGGQGEDCVAR